MNQNKIKLAQAICDFLDESIKDGSITDTSSIEGLDYAKDNANTTDLSIKPATLSSIFDLFVKTQTKLNSKPTTLPDTESLKKADELKQQGNQLMAQKNFSDAIKAYSDAIAIDAQNCVYYANRAAAYSQNNEHQKAVDDSKKALEIDPKYSKAYSRLGHAFYCLSKYEDAVSAYENGLLLEPENQSMKQSLATAKSKVGTETLPATRGSTAPSPTSGSPGGVDIASMMSNPNFMNMASQFMSNPAMASLLQNPAISQMASSLMSDPNGLSNLMNNPEMSRLAQSLGTPPSNNQ